MPCARRELRRARRLVMTPSAGASARTAARRAARAPSPERAEVAASLRTRREVGRRPLGTSAGSVHVLHQVALQLGGVDILSATAARGPGTGAIRDLRLVRSRRTRASAAASCAIGAPVACSTAAVNSLDVCGTGTLAASACSTTYSSSRGLPQVLSEQPTPCSVTLSRYSRHQRLHASLASACQ